MALKHLNIYFFIQLMLYAFIFYKFGFIMAFPVIYTLMKVFELVMKHFFSLELIRGSDLSMYLEDDNNYHNCISASILDKSLTMAQIRDDLVAPKMISKFDDFRRSVRHLFGMYFWVTRPATPEVIQAASKQVKLIDEKMDTQEDIQEFMQRVTALQLPRDGLQWEFYVKEKYQGDKTVIIWNFHHALVDGMGGMLLSAGVNG